MSYENKSTTWFLKGGPYRDILIFVLTLFIANALWKWLMRGEDGNSDTIKFLIWDLTSLFNYVAETTAHWAGAILSVFTDTIHLEDNNLLRCDSGFSMRINWSCTGIKQAFIFMMIIFMANGQKRHKLWFIPIAWLFFYGFNVIRIASIALLCQNHPDMFHIWHDIVFKYLYYGIMFVLWVVWTEKWRRIYHKQMTQYSKSY